MTEPNDQSAVPSSISPTILPTPLHPMTFGQILDRTYRLMRTHYRLLFGIAAVPATTLMVFFGAMMGGMLLFLKPQLSGHTSGIGAVVVGFPGAFQFLFFIIYPAILLTYALYLPAACFAATQADRGVTVSFRQAYGVAWSRLGRYLWLMILCALSIVVPVMAIGGLIVGGTVFLTGVKSNPASAFFLIPLLVLLYLVILVYSILIMLRLAVVYPVCVEEDLPAWAAIRRSVNLTRNEMGRIFLVMLVVYAILYAIELVCILIFVVLAGLVAFIAISAHVTVCSPAFFILIGLGLLGYALVIGFCVLIGYAGFTTALAVLYHDQRLRNDGLAILTPMPPIG